MNKANNYFLFTLLFCVILSQSCIYGKLGHCTDPPSRKMISKTDDLDENSIGHLRLNQSDYEVKCVCTGLRQMTGGGIGNVFTVTGWNRGIYVENRHDKCVRIEVKRIAVPFFPFYKWSPWKGQTEKGIKLGDTFKNFMIAYPNARYDNKKAGWIPDEQESRVFKFNAFGKLDKIVIR